MNRKTFRSVGVFVVALTLLSSPTTTLAQGRGRGQAKVKQEQPERTARARETKEAKEARETKEARPVFGPRDREVIARYYSRHSGLPPGLAKRGGDLPPGLEKQLRRNGTLPPGLRKKLRPFPADLERDLDPLPRRFRRAMLDDHVVVYDRDNYTIADFFRTR